MREHGKEKEDEENLINLEEKIVFIGRLVHAHADPPAPQIRMRLDDDGFETRRRKAAARLHQHLPDMYPAPGGAAEAADRSIELRTGVVAARWEFDSW